MSHSTHSPAAISQYAHCLPTSLVDDVLDSFAHGEPLCCLARPGGGGMTLLDEVQDRLGQGRRVVRCSLLQCRDAQDAVVALAAAMQGQSPRARSQANTGPGTWRETLAMLLGQLTEQGPAALLLEDISAWLLAWQGGVAAGQDSSRRMDLRVWFDQVARAASPRLTVVLLATPGLTTLLKCHRVEDVLTPFNELTINLPEMPEAVAQSDPVAVAGFVQTRATALGLGLTPELAARVVALAGEAFPEHAALVLDHLAKTASAEVPAILEDMVAERLLGAFERRRWRLQEDALYACVEPGFTPLVVELLQRAAAGGVTVEESFKLAGVGSAFGSMPVHVLRQYLEWLEQEGFLERRGDRYRTPETLFGRWLAAMYGGQSAGRAATSAAPCEGGDPAA